MTIEGVTRVNGASEGHAGEKRFTIDGSGALEQRLERTCERVVRGVRRVIPEAMLKALVLGGGYGRGEGGVLSTARGDQPYNDLEFYVFVRGSLLWSTLPYTRALSELGESLSPDAGLHVEFKIDSAERFRNRPVSMFSYDLVSGHRILSGEESIFDGCAHHLRAGSIPVAEATRLLFNRGTGLLLVRELLDRRQLTTEQADFVGRNLAKMRLALGDAVLTAFGRYHWSCLERRRRLASLRPPEALAWFEEVRLHHASGVEFKLRPWRFNKSVEEYEEEHRHLAQLSLQLWLWLEARRLDRPFASAREYAAWDRTKCPESAAWRNCLLNVKSFGLKAALDSMAFRYPRERLFNALALLLWNGRLGDPEMTRHLQKQLHTQASDWPGFLAAYKQIWPAYG